MTLYISNVHVCSIEFIDREMRVYFVTQLLKQGINIKIMCPNYILELRNRKSHLLQVYLGAWAKNDNWLFVCYNLYKT